MFKLCDSKTKAARIKKVDANKAKSASLEITAEDIATVCCAFRLLNWLSNQHLCCLCTAEGPNEAVSR